MMLKEHYLELIIITISFLSFFVTGIAIQTNERFFSLYEYTPLDTIYVRDYAYDDYLILIDEINDRNNMNIKSIYYSILIDHENSVYSVYYDSDELFHFGVPMIGLNAFARVNQDLTITLPKAVEYKDNPITRRYLNYSYQFIKIESYVPSESQVYMVIDTTYIDKDQISSISNDLDLDSIFSNPVVLSEIISGFHSSIQFFYLTFQSLSIIPIVFGFVISFMFYKMNNFGYIKDMLIMRINGISKMRLFIYNIGIFLGMLIIPIVIGVSLATIVFLFIDILIITLESLNMFIIIFMVLLLVTSGMETRKVFKTSLTRLVE